MIIVLLREYVYLFSMNNLIIQLLASEKLYDNNYVTWKLQLNIILVIDDLRFILIEEYPQTPALNANQIVGKHLIGGSKLMRKLVSTFLQA